MMKIESRENPLITEVAKLKDKKYRLKQGLFVVEGEKMVREAIAAGLVPEMLFATETCLARMELSQENLRLVSDSVMQKLSDTVTPQGVLAVLKQRYVPLRKPEGSCLVLDRISDAGNLGTVIRTAAACGIADVYCVNCVDWYNPKVIRSTMSGIFYVNLMSGTEDDVLQILRDSDCELVCADMDGEDVFSCRIANFALVIGNEANGVSEGFRAAAAKTVRIPMKNVESLNAAVSAAIIMYTLKN